MKILIPRWHPHHLLDEIVHLLEKEGHAVLHWETFPRNYHYDPVFRRKFTDAVAQREIDHVFSIQYYPILSNLCNQLCIPYISWCCNDPANQRLLTKSIYNPCNIIFHGDSCWVAKLRRLGAGKAAYLPWAASAPIASIAAPACTDATSPEAQAGINATSGTEMDICLIDTGNPEAWRHYLALMAKIDQQSKGFLDGLMQAQQGIYGFPFLEHALNDTVLAAMEKALPLPNPRDGIASREELYARQVLYPAITRREMDAMLNLLANESPWRKICLTKRAEELPPSFLRGELPAECAELSTVANSKIYLLPAPRDIQNGIPAQAMDIMGGGGFLLTSFQSDYLRFFQPGKDYVYYESPEDMVNQAGYYLEHEEERQEIARQGQRKVMAGHTLEMRIQEMLDLLSQK